MFCVTELQSTSSPSMENITLVVGTHSGRGGSEVINVDAILFHHVYIAYA